MSHPEQRIPKAVVFGCAGTELTRQERQFFADEDPLGFILFARNCTSPDQVRALVRAMRASVGRDDAPILIDQEGGRVTRLKPPHWRAPPSAGVIGALYQRDAAAGLEAVRLNARLMAVELSALGIDVDCVPVLDVPAPDSNRQVVGDRAFTGDAAANTALGRAVCEAMLDGGILPVLKHMPGHGKARVDSHHELPVVDAPLDELRRVDFAPFHALAGYPAGMVAHLLFPAVDRDRPASTSATVIAQIIRGEIGFDGLLFSDDIGMSALGGTMGERAARTVAAGCDLAVHCSGNFAEMQDVAASVGPMTAAAVTRLTRARGARRAPKPFDATAAVDRLQQLMSGVERT